MMAVMRQQSIDDRYGPDRWLLISVILLIAFGLVMMTSASVEVAQARYGDAFYHLKRQSRFLIMSCVAAMIVLSVPVEYWKRFAGFLYISAVMLLVLVLIPGIGREAGGGTRWLNLGFMTIQASEPAKLFIIVFISWWLSENRELVRKSWRGFVMPLFFVSIPVVLLLREPDFGAVVVLMIAVFGVMFLAGVNLWRFVLVSLLAMGAGVGLIITSEYRMRRVESFIQALSDPFNESVVYGSGYQLAQALIAFGRGEWLGVGLGNSIQKIYFLPDAHTDFVLAIIAEELGFVTVLLLISLFLVFICRGLAIARRNEKAGRLFQAYLAYGITFLFAAQILINVAVNVGLLPTKGLTLPFISYGGSSLIVCIVMVSLLLRIDIEYEHDRQTGVLGAGR